MFHSQTPDEVATDLEAAADIIRINGLHKGDFWPGAVNHYTGEGRVPTYVPGYPVCAYGAVSVARGVVNVVSVQPCPATAIMEKHVSGQLVDWNDDERTTAEQMVDLMTEVAKNLRNGVIDTDGNEIVS